MMKTIVFIFKSTPIGSSLSREGIDMALAAASFDQSVKVIFLGDGVFQLLKSQTSNEMIEKNIAKMISSFELFGICDIVVDKQSLQDRSLKHSDLIESLPLQISTDIKEVVNTADHIINF